MAPTQIWTMLSGSDEAVEAGVESGETPDDDVFGSLSWATRVQGFVACLALSFLTSGFSWLALTLGRYTRYATLCTLANLLAMFGTLFLMGPVKQCRNMFDAKRAVATAVFLGSMAATVFAALYLNSAILCAIFSTAQYLALLWYSLSYIPYGRDVVSGFVTRIFSATTGL